MPVPRQVPSRSQQVPAGPGTPQRFRASAGLSHRCGNRNRLNWPRILGAKPWMDGPGPPNSGSQSQEHVLPVQLSPCCSASAALSPGTATCTGTSRQSPLALTFKASLLPQPPAAAFLSLPTSSSILPPPPSPSPPSPSSFHHLHQPIPLFIVEGVGNRSFLFLQSIPSRVSSVSPVDRLIRTP